MASDNTKIIIICNDQRELQIMHDHLRKLSDELNIFMITDQSFYEHFHVCFGNTIGIWVFVKEYSYTDCFCCDYFAISTFDPDYIKEWQKHLSPHGKELINFDDIRNKIKELVSKEKKTAPKYYMPIDVVKIKNVIFNPPATIVFWTDGTKTVVKAQDGDAFDPEKGLAMAISKKALGNKGNYCNELKKWLPKKETLRFCTMSEIVDSVRKLGEAASKIQFPISKPVIDNCKSCDPLCNTKVRTAYCCLVNALHDKKATKAYFEAAMEEAIEYLGEALDD